MHQQETRQFYKKVLNVKPQEIVSKNFWAANFVRGRQIRNKTMPWRKIWWNIWSLKIQSVQQKLGKIWMMSVCSFLYNSKVLKLQKFSFTFLAKISWKQRFYSKIRIYVKSITKSQKTALNFDYEFSACLIFYVKLILTDFRGSWLKYRPAHPNLEFW